LFLSFLKIFQFKSPVSQHSHQVNPKHQVNQGSDNVLNAWSALTPLGFSSTSSESRSGLMGFNQVNPKHQVNQGSDNVLNAWFALTPLGFSSLR